MNIKGKGESGRQTVVQTGGLTETDTCSRWRQDDGLRMKAPSGSCTADALTAKHHVDLLNLPPQPTLTLSVLTITHCLSFKMQSVKKKKQLQGEYVWLFCVSLYIVVFLEYPRLNAFWQSQCVFTNEGCSCFFEHINK